jgi:hypothetical protein
MRHYRNAEESVDGAAIINAGLALRDLAKTDARMWRLARISHHGDKKAAAPCY